MAKLDLDYEERIATGGAGGAPNAQCYVTTGDTGLLYESTAKALPWIPNPGGRAGEVSTPIRHVEKLFRLASFTKEGIDHVLACLPHFGMVETVLHVDALQAALQGMADDGFFHDDDGEVVVFEDGDALLED